MMQLKRFACPLLSIGMIFCAACGPTLEEGTDARIRVTPARQITFSKVSVGDTRMLPFVVTSVGRDALTVRKIEWEGASSVTLVAEGSVLPRDLPNQASMPVSVQFAPTADEPAPDGIIKIYSNDPDAPVYTLEVAAQQLAPQIHVVPSAEEKLIFGQTDPGLTTTKEVVVTNVGDLPLTIDSIRLNAAEVFTYAVSRELPVTLAANSAEDLRVQVAFSPTDIGKQEGTVVFASNDPVRPQYALPIVANSDTPCLQIHPTLLEFTPAQSVGTSVTKPVKLTSCSDVPLVISNVMKIAGADVFTHDLEGAGTALKNGESATLNVTYSPISEGVSQAEYVILNNDPLQANAVLKVMGTASANQCPTAAAKGRLSSSSEWSKNLDLAPLDTVMLDGTQSTDKESSELKYYWSIHKAPSDSTSKIAADGATASFFLDLAGNYELCLNVEDSAGMMSCNTDCVTVTATPRETIHVQLVWHTPADTVEGDGDGTDLDLHFLTLPSGTWGDYGTASLNNGTDACFLNQAPSWAVEGYPNEQPSLDRDDKDGEGPENINLDKPAPCRWYAIGAHYYTDNAFGESCATVRVFVDGKERFARYNMCMAQTGVFKQVAWLFWDGQQARFYESDLSYQTNLEWVGLKPTVPAQVMESARAALAADGTISAEFIDQCLGAKP